MLYKVGVEKQYEFIQDIMETKQVRALIWAKIKNYPHRKDEIKAIAEFKVKEAILAEYSYEEDGTEGKFVNFLKRRPLARLHETISWEVFHQRIPRKRKGVKKRKLNKEYPEISTEPDVVFGMIEGNKPDDFDSVDEHVDLITSLGHLTPEERQIIILDFQEGKTDQEIAETIGKSRSTVVSTKKRALEKMKKMMS